jgi:RNA polymerase sigma-70 factor, ECF subfamily
VDSGPSQSADLTAQSLPAGSAMAAAAVVSSDCSDASAAPLPELGSIPSGLLHELANQAEISASDLTESEFAEVLLGVGAKSNFGAPPGTLPDAARRAAFLRALHLRDLALAHGCARGKDAAWQRFVRQLRAPLREAAIAITRSSSDGEDLADSLYSELFGLTEREGRRWSPLATYSGRGSLMGWLRATLAQRHVDRHRAVHRESDLEGDEIPAAAPVPQPETEILMQLTRALAATLPALSAEDRFLLSAYFLDGRTLLDLARLLRVHEATISRRVRRLTDDVHRRLLKQLEAGGMRRRAAQEALGTDPRDLTVNLRNLLQTSPDSAFFQKTDLRTGQDRS